MRQREVLERVFIFIYTKLRKYISATFVQHAKNYAIIFFSLTLSICGGKLSVNKDIIKDIV